MIQSHQARPRWWIPRLPSSLTTNRLRIFSRARATGLRTRPLAETVRDTLAWALTPAGQAVAAQLQGIGLAPEREAALLQKWATTG